MQGQRIRALVCHPDSYLRLPCLTQTLWGTARTAQIASPRPRNLLYKGPRVPVVITAAFLATCCRGILAESVQD